MTLTQIDRDADRVATAWHEAGHVTAYLTKGLPVRYATLRPRTADAVGLTAIRRRMIPVWDAAVIGHAGPTAQGMHAWRTRDTDDDEGLDESDYLFGAYLSGGSCDLAKAAAAQPVVGPDGADLWEWSAKQLLTLHWPVVTAIAEALLTHMTVSGPTLRGLALSAAADAGISETHYMLRSGQ